jgi:uncharacterized protein YndB with AHSA1/START domain
MMNANNKLTVSKDLEKLELTLERVMNGTPILAWEGWTNAKHITRWWGPKFWTTTVYVMDVRLGGVWHYCMRPDNDAGAEVWGRAVFHEIVKPSRLMYLESKSNAAGDILEANQRSVTVEFRELYPSMTLLIIRTRFTTKEELNAAASMGITEGFAEAFDRLEALNLNVEL